MIAAPMPPVFALLACASTLFAAPSIAPARLSSTPSVERNQNPQGGDPLQRLRGWLKRQREGRERLDESSLVELRLLVSDLRLVWAVDPARGDEIADHLLDLLGMALTSFDPAALEVQTSPAMQV